MAIPDEPAHTTTIPIRRYGLALLDNRRFEHRIADHIQDFGIDLHTSNAPVESIYPDQFDGEAAFVILDRLLTRSQLYSAARSLRLRFRVPIIVVSEDASDGFGNLVQVLPREEAVHEIGRIARFSRPLTPSLRAPAAIIAVDVSSDAPIRAREVPTVAQSDTMIETTPVATRKRVFSGIQPSGDSHIGNYLGAIRNWVVQQEQYDNVFCIVNLHALTLPTIPDQLVANSIAMTNVLLAAGIDPEKSILFLQSDVREHSELCWLLGSVCTFGELSRMTQFKDKTSGKGEESISSALFFYAVLQVVRVVATARMHHRIAGPRRATIASTAEFLGGVSGLFVFAGWAIAGLWGAIAVAAAVAVGVVFLPDVGPVRRPGSDESARRPEWGRR